jgi:hypothetical protein
VTARDITDLIEVLIGFVRDHNIANLVIPNLSVLIGEKAQKGLE